MTIENIIFAIISGGIFVTMILIVVFGQMTVRKLRKNPETKGKLGVTFYGGGDILNVAQALWLPQVLLKKMEKSRLYFMFANAELLYKHTTVFDRVLARILFTLFVVSGSSLILLVLLDSLGIFE